ncbi:MAG: T9SS type A sorting domain-containing protein, partial [Candidatus Goldbacteria bacterium]|nr:T9SS type A sorting domain-containing protein [Candidatus Goldiibacteriota bacterium]
KATRTITPTATVTPDVHSTNLEITLVSNGENAQLGAVIEYKIIIENKDSSVSAYNIRVWDTLPQEVTFIDNYFIVSPTIENGVLVWDLPDDFELKPGEKIIIEFRVRMNNTDGQGFIKNVACIDYQDGYYNDTFGNGRHPVIASNINEYPEEPIIVYPNPFKLSDSKFIKFVNLPPNCSVQIYTLSGERVISLNIFAGSRVVWDAKNVKGREVSPGIYYYVVYNKYSKQVVRGKLFIIK